ncbi:hypothetical protein GCM10009000_103950 [Halobacterium noricense]
MNLTDVPVEAVGKGADALGWLLHQTPYQLQAARRENALEPAGVLEVDDVGTASPCSQRSARFSTLSVCSSNGVDVIRSVEEYSASAGDSCRWSGECLLMDGIDLFEDF